MQLFPVINKYWSNRNIDGVILSDLEKKKKLNNIFGVTVFSPLVVD